MRAFQEPVISNRLIISYSLYSSVFLFTLLTFLYFSDLYLKIGSTNFVPFLILLICVEIIKFIYSNSTVQNSTFINSGSKKWNKSKTLYDLAAGQVLSQVKLKKILKSIVLLAFSVAIFFAISILLGAEFLAKHEETLMFSSLIVVLIFLPICLHLGPDSLFNFLLTANPANAFEQILFRNVQFVLVGAWFGAFVIPLDWDRPWQIWPIPCSFASILGYLISHVVTCIQYSNMFIHKKTVNKFGKRVC
ncbi:phosphatidylinositol-glycan biosynthesis class F protein [Bemisia tabaci]|uniref:phosphatidylinositol-glycan biosynthesis class F protein n=1 Tax=Bemisia tabaci TaxID=7038 RepID=UPI003B28964E